MLFQFKAALKNYGLDAGQTEGATRPQVGCGVASAKADLAWTPQAPDLL